MKKIFGIATWIIMLTITTTASAQGSKLGFYGVGGHFSSVKPENIGATFGVGGQVDLGTVVSTLHLYPSIQLWRKSETEEILYTKMKSSYTEVSINADVRYYFSRSSAAKVKPFVGGGLALVITSVSVDLESTWDFGSSGGLNYSTSTSDTDIGLEILGGLDFPLSTSLTGFLEGKVKIDGIDTYRITGGLTFPIGAK